jgi:hypothetical protein
MERFKNMEIMVYIVGIVNQKYGKYEIFFTSGVARVPWGRGAVRWNARF